MEEAGQEGFKFTGLSMETSAVFDIIVLRIVDIDFNPLGMRISWRVSC